MSTDEARDLKIRRVDWYFDEWLAGTARLDAAERGVYVTICNLIYSHGGPIDSEGLASLCGCHGNAFRRIIARLKKLGKIIENGSQIGVKRCGKEIERALIRLEKASENGGKGGRPSNKINGLEKPAGYFPGKLAGASFNLQPTTYNLQPKETRASRASSNDAFDRWWEGYPEKVGKGAARKAFPKALSKTSLDQLIAGVERYKATKPVDRSWCNPATWLNQERWLDVHASNGADHNALPFGGGPPGPAPTLEELRISMERSYA